MHVTCKDNAGFEDGLELGKTYQVRERGVNGYRIEDERGALEWYGAVHFTPVLI